MSFTQLFRLFIYFIFKINFSSFICRVSNLWRLFFTQAADTPEKLLVLVAETIGVLAAEATVVMPVVTGPGPEVYLRYYEALEAAVSVPKPPQSPTDWVTQDATHLTINLGHLVASLPAFRVATQPIPPVPSTARFFHLSPDAESAAAPAASASASAASSSAASSSTPSGSAPADPAAPAEKQKRSPLPRDYFQQPPATPVRFLSRRLPLDKPLPSTVNKTEAFERLHELDLTAPYPTDTATAVEFGVGLHSSHHMLKANLAKILPAETDFDIVWEYVVQTADTTRAQCTALMHIINALSSGLCLFIFLFFDIVWCVVDVTISPFYTPSQTTIKQCAQKPAPPSKR